MKKITCVVEGAGGEEAPANLRAAHVRHEFSLPAISETSKLAKESMVNPQLIR